jgi:hypothetical protein
MPAARFLCPCGARIGDGVASELDGRVRVSSEGVGRGAKPLFGGVVSGKKLSDPLVH